MNRRRFLTHLAAASAAVPVLAPAATAATSADPGLIDTNVYLASWPTRVSWAPTPAALVEKFRQHGVTSAWTGSLDGVLHSDIAAVNTRVAETCAREGAGILRPIGTINPTLPDWEEDLRRCHEVHRMAGVRLFPNYHGYTLDDPRFGRLLDLAGQRRVLVQVVVSIEDDRSQNPALTAAPVQPGPLGDWVQRFPATRVMLLNSASRVLTASTPLLQRLIAANVLFEIATLETVAGIAGVLQRAPGVKLAFGSHAPYYYFEAALLKLQESALTAAQLAAIRHENARAALLPA